MINPFACGRRHLFVAVCALVLWSCEVAGLDGTVPAVRIDYKIFNPTPPPLRLKIPGQLRTPKVAANPEDKVPAVVIAHGNRGIGGTGARYAAAFCRRSALDFVDIRREIIGRGAAYVRSNAKNTHR